MVVDGDARHVRVVATDVGHHEHFEGGRAGLGQPGDLLGDGAGRVVAEVDDRFSARVLDVRLEPLHRVGRRLDVGHVQHRGHPARGGGAGTGQEVLFVGEAGVAQVTVSVNQAGQHGLTGGGGVDGALGCWQQLAGRDQLRDVLAINGERAVEPAVGRGDAVRGDQKVHRRKCILHAPARNRRGGNIGSDRFCYA